MKGVVFNLLEEVVSDAHGAHVWDQLLAKADLEGTYTSLGSYADDEMMRLVAAAADALALPPTEILRWFGRNAIPLLFERWPGFFDAHKSTLPFLHSLNSVIHPEVRKLYPGAHCPVFDFTVQNDKNALVIGYHSRRKLCSLAEGFIQGAGAHYDEPLSIQHSRCMHHGDDKCLITVACA